MPTYEYTCIECDTSKDLIRPVDERDEPVFCESCGYTMNRVYNPSPIQFKGSGFYSTGG